MIQTLSIRQAEKDLYLLTFQFQEIQENIKKLQMTTEETSMEPTL